MAVDRGFEPGSLTSASETPALPNNREFLFSMASNGYFPDATTGQFKFEPGAIHDLVKQFTNTRTSFFGGNLTSNFFSAVDVDYKTFILAFSQQPYIEVIKRFIDVDRNQAVRLAFLFGGIVRHLSHHSHLHFLPDQNYQLIPKAVKFASQMTGLAQSRSAEAVASALGMYIISGGSVTTDSHFTGHVYHMTEAIQQDPIVVGQTAQLGLSQLARLHHFINRDNPRPIPDITGQLAALTDFPTVGAEFHLPLDAQRKFPNLWQRLAILNMSQYQPDSFIPLSRNDQDVIEVRMNPSYYPITIANWNHLRLLLPELNQAYFLITLNRQGLEEDFVGGKPQDSTLLQQLRGLASLCYATLFTNVPPTQGRAEINFGSAYLGQTVRLHQGKYYLTGMWARDKTAQAGQMNLYAGFGDNFPHLAYYLSMALTNPAIIKLSHRRLLSKIQSPSEALKIDPRERRLVFQTIDERIQLSLSLQEAVAAGEEIMRAFEAFN